MGLGISGTLVSIVVAHLARREVTPLHDNIEVRRAPLDRPGRVRNVRWGDLGRHIRATRASANYTTAYILARGGSSRILERRREARAEGRGDCEAPEMSTDSRDEQGGGA